MARVICSVPSWVVIAVAGLAVGSSQCGSSPATSVGDDASSASEGAAREGTGGDSGSATEEGSPGDANGESGGPSGDGANSEGGGPSEPDATSSPDGQPADASQLDGSESRDAPREAQGDAGMCTSDSDCGPDQWCVEFVQTRGLIDITHTQCVTTTCTSVDCSCAQSMCGSYYCSVANGQLVCRNNDV